MAPPGLERPLFVHERLMLPPDGLYNVIVALRLVGRTGEAALRSALDRLQARHAMLRVAIDRSGRRPRFTPIVPGRPIPLRIVRGAGEADWRAAVQAEIDLPLPLDGGPLARAVWLERDSGGDLLLVVHHAIADAIAAYAMAEAMVGWMAGAGPERAPPPAIGTIDALFGAPAPGEVGLRARVRDAALSAAATGAGWLLGRAVGASRLWRPARAPVASRIHFCQFDEALTRALERRARRERVTVYAVLATVFLRVLLARHPASTLNRLVCPIDVRHQFDLRHPELPFPTPISVRLSIDRRLDPDPWAQARALNEALSRKRRAIRVRLWLPALERLHGVVGGMVEGQLRARRTIDLSFAHLGSVAFEAPGGDPAVAFETALGATASMPWSDTMLVTSLRSAGRLRFCVSTNDVKLPPAEAAAFLDAVVAMVGEIAGPE